MAKKATKKKAVKKKTSTKKKVTKEMLVVGSKTKLALKGSGKNTLNVSSETLDAINDKIYQIVEEARNRCVANGRKTVRPYDIVA